MRVPNPPTTPPTPPHQHLLRHAGEGVSKFLLSFLQVDPSEWTKFLVLLGCLSLVYRGLAMLVLGVRGAWRVFVV